MISAEEGNVEKPFGVDDIGWAELRSRLAQNGGHQTLLMASLVLTAFELLKQSVTLAPRLLDREEEGPDGRFTTGFVDGKLRTTAQFRSLVAPYVDLKHADNLLEGARWLAGMGALEQEEVLEISDLRDYRNEIAHELASFVFDADRAIDPRRCARLVELLGKVERWRVRIDLEAQGRVCDEKEMQTGPIMLIDMLRRVFSELAGTGEPPGPKRSLV